MCIMCVASRWSRRIVTMLPCIVIPLLILWALSQVLPPGLRFEVTSPRLACVFVLLVILGWYEVVMPRLLQWRARRSALLRDRKRIQAQEAAKWRKEATRRCRNCLTAYRDQAPAGGRFMCTYCGHVSRRPVLDIPGIASGLVSPGVPANGVVLKGGITQIGIPVASLYSGKNVKSWNGKGWPVAAGWSGGKSKLGDSPWAKEWPANDSWLKGSWAGTPSYFANNGNICGDAFGGGEKCSACDSYPRIVIFFLRIIGFFFFCVTWVWKRVLRRGSLGNDQSLNLGSKAGLRKGEEGYNAQGTKGEKARRKAEERRHARLEKEMREEEERKQREEVARLVEEQRRLRDEKLKAEKESQREAEAQKEKEIKKEKEVERRRQDKIHEKEKRLAKDKLQAEGEEATKKEKETERKGETEKREVSRTSTFHFTEKKVARNFRVFRTDNLLKNNEQGMKGGINSAFKAGGSRYIGPAKVIFQSPPKTSAWQSNNVALLSGKSFGTDSCVGVKSSKSANSGDAVSLSDNNTYVGCTTFTQNTCSAWNKTDRTKPWGKGSNIINEGASRREISTPNSKGENSSSTFETENPAGKCVSNGQGVKQLQPSVVFQVQPSSPVSMKTNSLDPHLTSPSTSFSVATSAVVGSSLEQEHQMEVGKKSVAINEAVLSPSSNHVCFGSTAAVIHPPIPTMSMSSNSVPDYTSQSINSDNIVSPRVSMSPGEVDPFEDLLSTQNPVAVNMPLSESLINSSLNLKPKVISETQTIGVSSPVGTSVCTPIQRPAPIELPISKWLPSDIVDEVDVTRDQFPPITEPWGLRSLSLDCPNDMFKQFEWPMWHTQQLEQRNLPNLVEPSQLPAVSGMFEEKKDFLPPCSEGTLLSPYVLENHLPSSLFSPQEKPNNFNQSSGNHISGASVSNSNSLWANQPACQSAEASWNVPNHHRVPPSFFNGGTQGEAQDSTITTDHHPYEQIPTSFWLKSGIDGTDKKIGSAKAAANASTRPCIGGIYAAPHVQSVWAYK